MEHLGLEYEEVTLDERAIGLDLPTIVGAQELPQDGGSVVPKWYLAKEIARQGYKVVLGGSGADEIFGGYSRHEYRYGQVNAGPLDDKSDLLFLHEKLHKGPGDERLLRHYRRSGRWYDFGTYYDIDCELPYYHNPRLDKTFMAHSLEYRVPYQDLDLAEYVLNIPLELRMSGGVRKRLLLDAAECLIPASILNRPKKPLRIPHLNHDREEWARTIYSAWEVAFSDCLVD